MQQVVDGLQEFDNNISSPFPYWSDTVLPAAPAALTTPLLDARPTASSTLPAHLAEREYSFCSVEVEMPN